MNSIQEAFLKSFNPTSAIAFTNLDKVEVPIKLLEEVHKYLGTKYTTYLDKEVGVIYIGKRI